MPFETICFRRASAIPTCFGLALILLLTTSPAAAAPGDPCPSAFTLHVDPNPDDADLGFTGTMHDQSLVGWDLRALLDGCAGSQQPSCGECEIDGLIPTAGAGNQRCYGDTSIVCQADSDCGFTNFPCVFYASPPTGFSIGGISLCMVNQIAGPVGGTLDVEAGAAEIVLPLEQRLSIGTLFQPCPNCVGGFCDGGPRDNLACQVHASSFLYGDTSFDCPPGDPDLAPGMLTLSTVPVVATTDALELELSAASPNCKASGWTVLKCPCDTCQTLDGEPCMTDADCPVGRTCGGLRCLGGPNAGNVCTDHSQCTPGLCATPGEPTRSNACVDLICTPSGGDEGECTSGPFIGSCSEQTFKECASDSGCRPPGEGGSCLECAPGLQTCTFAAQDCFTDNGVIGGSVVASGAASPPTGNTSQPDLGALFCIPPMGAGAGNAVLGLPGLGRYRLDTVLTFAEEVAAALVGEGGGVTTDTEADGATPADPVETSVGTANAGEIVITETFVATPPPIGYQLFGRQIEITAPDGSLELIFTIDASIVPAGGTAATVEIFRNGILVPPCPGDPCVFARTTLGGGDIEITVLTSQASAWNFGAPPQDGLCPPAPASGCRQPAVGQKAQLLLKDKDDEKDQILWKWLKGVTTPKADYGLPTGGESYELCIYEEGNLVSSTELPAGGICGTTLCWAEKTTSFKYKDKELTPDGALKAQLSEGLVDGKAKILVKAKGIDVEMPNLATFDGTVDVRLMQSSDNVCWGATYSLPFLKNDGATFKDKAD